MNSNKAAVKTLKSVDQICVNLRKKKYDGRGGHPTSLLRRLTMDGRT